MSTFKKELEDLINRHSKENGSDTPDFMLAEYLDNCLKIFNEISQAREEWYGRKPNMSKIPVNNDVDDDIRV